MISQSVSEDFLICRSQSDDAYQVYRVNLNAPGLFTFDSLTAKASFNHSYRIAQVGAYLLQWSPLVQQSGSVGYNYHLVKFDPAATDPDHQFGW